MNARTLAGIQYAYFTPQEVRAVYAGEACPVFVNPFDPYYPFGNLSLASCPGPIVGVQYPAGDPPVGPDALEAMKRAGQEAAAYHGYDLSSNRVWDQPPPDGATDPAAATGEGAAPTSSPTVTTAGPSPSLLAVGIFLLFVFGTSYAAAPR